MFSERIARLKPSLVREILAISQQPGMISFAGGLPASESLAALDWSTLPAEIGQYGPSEGEADLRSAIAERARRIGIDCQPEQVLILSGSQQGIDLVAKLFVDPGVSVLTEAPTYIAALQVFELFGARCTGLKLGHTGVDPVQLQAEISSKRPAFAYLIPTFQNPSGICYDEATRSAVASVFDREALTLFEDDPYRDLVFGACDRRPICARLQNAPWIYQGSFSKVYAPGLRIGYLIASPSLIPLLTRLKQATDLHSNRPGQWLAAAALRSAGWDARIEQLCDHYRRKRDTLQASLQRHFTGLAQWHLPSGGLFFWLELRGTADPASALPKALARGVAFMPGAPFFPQQESVSPYIRLNFSNAPEAAIDSAIEVLAALFSAH